VSQFSVFNSIESLNNILPVLVCEKVRNVSGTLGFLAAYLTAAGDLGGGPTIEEKRYRHLQQLCELLKAACTDAVSALFVFLYLLESYTDAIGKGSLTHFKHHSAHSNPFSDMSVSRIRLMLMARNHTRNPRF